MVKELTKEQAIKTYIKGNTGEIQAVSPEYKEAVVSSGPGCSKS